MTPSVSVIIPVYNDESGLQTTLESLFSQSIHSDTYEIIVSNDGGSQAIESLCKRFQITCINIIPNQGSYHARNQAVTQARSNLMAFVDADIVVPSSWLSKGIEAAKKADYIAGPVQIIKKDTMSLAALYEYYTAFSSDRYISEFRFGVTGNLFVKKRVFDVVGLFNSQLRSSGDYEFGNRVHQHGAFRQTYDTDLIVYHPPRGHHDYLKKIKRVTEGTVTLATLKTVDYSRIQPTLFKSLAKIFLPPHPFKTKLYQKHAKPFVPLYLYHWYTNMYRGCYTIRAMIKMKYFKL